jgi:hypothetical protein
MALAATDSQAPQSWMPPLPEFAREKGLPVLVPGMKNLFPTKEEESKEKLKQG